jgi:hypothetical protein
MRARPIIIAVACLGIAPSLVASAPDHLVPPYEDRDWGLRGYASFVQKHLFLTPATYGRILVHPSPASIGEYSLSIYPSREPGLVHVTLVRASRNVWSYLSDKRHGVAVPPIHEPWEVAPLRFHRSDATLPMSAGAALRAVFAIMLHDTRGRYPGYSGGVIVDGYDIEFSLSGRDMTMRGVITANVSGKNVSELRKLVDLLESYCQAQSARQASLVGDIERKAKLIVTRASKT